MNQIILYRLLFLFFLPLSLHAQDTATVKRQAGLFAHATFKGDVAVIIAGTYPKLIELSGGKEQMQQLITERMEELKKQGITSFEGTVGTPGKIYKSGTQLHCLIPEQIILKTAAGRYLARSYLLGVSDDNGESWTFLDVGNMPADVLRRLLPNFNEELKIPAPVKPEFLAN
ncbi:hypothetical protein IDJ77_24935 [Mucilaginibacter sp. ZT4R22]|uniref:DUF4252 domain-containing protein n=1 Tax=Mucilaginibacter pankratovii TaxID=2772110 RepID=A0ABR7WXR4_9SPHI|nr:hypothetical protein [Mucilaginibacter pankratovii]MBD1367080.1 hypothetical protein [Mucilaginibacter pankratovii]